MNMRKEIQVRQFKNKLTNLNRLYDIMDKLIAGWERSDLEDYLSNHYEMTPANIHTQIHNANQELKKRKLDTVENLATEHTLRYERLYKELHEMGWNNLAMKALRAKERMLGIDRKRGDGGMKISVNNRDVDIDISAEYNIKQLSEKKRKRFDELLLKLNGSR